MLDIDIFIKYVLYFNLNIINWDCSIIIIGLWKNLMVKLNSWLIYLILKI